VESILKVPLSSTWKKPTLDMYDGITNQDECVDAYIMQVRLHTTDDVLLCRIFLTSLKEMTLSWFIRLPTHSIDCFDTLVTKFGA